MAGQFENKSKKPMTELRHGLPDLPRTTSWRSIIEVQCQCPCRQSGQFQTLCFEHNASFVRFVG